MSVVVVVEEVACTACSTVAEIAGTPATNRSASFVLWMAER